MCVVFVALAGCTTTDTGDGRFRETPIDIDFDNEFDRPMTGDFSSLPRIMVGEFAPVYFAYDNYLIPRPEESKIDAVITFMRNNPNVVAIVEGHCDERGTAEYNMSLGEYRAQSVRSYMVNAGIPGDSLQTVSFGKEQPAVDGHTEAAWARNRRAQFVIVSE
ncbi:MAG: OmpA family protein [Kiritimatiellaeota bacterium]|nr:OmpA family protein [Kiritimatiellota bacterium]